MSISLNSYSRLRFVNLLTTYGITYWDMLQLPTIPARQDDMFYTVLDQDRIDTLAYKFYQDSVLWWIIAAANGLELLPSDLYTGQILRIPSLSSVQFLFAGTKVVQ